MLTEKDFGKELVRYRKSVLRPYLMLDNEPIHKICTLVDDLHIQVINKTNHPEYGIYFIYRHQNFNSLSELRSRINVKVNLSFLCNTLDKGMSII